MQFTHTLWNLFLSYILLERNIVQDFIKDRKMVATKKFIPKEGINQISSHSFSIVLKRLKIPEYTTKIDEIPHTLNYDSNGNIYTCIDLTCDSDEETTSSLHNESDEIVDIVSNNVSDLNLDEDTPSPVYASWTSPSYGPYESDDEGVDIYDVSSGAAPDRDESVTNELNSYDVDGKASQYEASSISDCKIKISRKKEGTTNVADSGAVAITTAVHDKLCAVFNALKPPSSSTTASKPCKKRVSHFVRSNEDRESEVVERLRRKLHPERRGRPKKHSNEKRKILVKISTNKVARYHQSNFSNLSKNNRSNPKKKSPSVLLSSITNVNSDSKDAAPLVDLRTNNKVFHEKAVNLVPGVLFSRIKASDEEDKKTIAGMEFPVKNGTEEEKSVPASSSKSSVIDSLISLPPVCMKRSLEALDLALPIQRKLTLAEHFMENLANNDEKLPINSNSNSCAIITYQNKIIHTVVLPKVAESSAPVKPSKSHIGTIRVVPLDQLRDPSLSVLSPNMTNVSSTVTVLPTARVESMPNEIVSTTTIKSRALGKSPYKRKPSIANGSAPIKSRKKCDTTETLFTPSNPQNVRQWKGVDLKCSPVSQFADESHLNNRSPSSTYEPWPVTNYGAQHSANHSQNKNVDSQVFRPKYLQSTRRVSQPSGVQQGFARPSFSQTHFPATETPQHHQATFTHTPGHHHLTFTQTQDRQTTLARIQLPPPYLEDVPTSMMQQQYAAAAPCFEFQQQQQQPFVENCGVSAQNPAAGPISATQLYNQQLPSRSAQGCTTVLTIYLMN